MQMVDCFVLCYTLDFKPFSPFNALTLPMIDYVYRLYTVIRDKKNMRGNLNAAY